MSSTDDMDARHGRILAELADAGMDVARGLHDASQRSRDNHELALLAEAFHAVSRSVRQTIALEFKLRHAPRLPAAPKPEPESKPASAPPSVPRDRPEQVCWNEHERADWDEPLDLLLAGGDREAVNTAIGASIARIRRGLATAGRALPATPEPGPTVAKGRDPDPDPPGPGPGRRNTLLSGASHRTAGFRAAPTRGDSGQGVARAHPPWRNSG